MGDEDVALYPERVRKESDGRSSAHTNSLGGMGTPRWSSVPRIGAADREETSLSQWDSN